MPRRSQRAEVALTTLALWLASQLSARAEPTGAIDARALIGFDQRYGAGVLADLWMGEGTLRLGGAAGLAALSRNDDASSRVVTPLAMSLAIMPGSEGAGFVAAVRLGGYVGAEKGGFIGGGFGSCALGYGIALGEGASVRVLADAWGLFGRRGGAFVGPALGLGF